MTDSKKIQDLFDEIDNNKDKQQQAIDEAIPIGIGGGQ